MLSTCPAAPEWSYALELGVVWERAVKDSWGVTHGGCLEVQRELDT